MNKNLVIFFNDGESDNLNEKTINLLSQTLGEDFSLLFLKDLDNNAKQQILKSTNTFTYVNPYWNTSLPEIKEHHLRELLDSLCELSTQAQSTTLFVTPYTTVLGDFRSREYDSFYKHMDTAFKKNNSPRNLLVAQRSDTLFAKLTSQYLWLALGREINELVIDKSRFNDIYRNLKLQNNSDEDTLQP